MFVVSVTIFVKPQFVGQFIDATLDNARNTRREAGNIRFDVLQAEDDASCFMLYEAYRDKSDLALHQQTGHYLRWKQAVTEWMAQPRQRVQHQALFFDDDVVNPLF
jgi:(4S)-4-hydroxy-5-phosphonooxypentane-2,3-dione isomerase